MRVNLLPPEIRERQRVRRRTLGVAALGLVLVGLVGALFVLRQIQAGGVREDVDAQQAENAKLQQQVSELSEVQQLQDQLKASKEIVNALLVDQIRWSGVLRDVSLVVPGQVWLTALSAQVASATEDELSTTQAPGLIGQITFNGVGLTHRAVAQWLTRLEDVEGFDNPWLSSSLKTEIGATEVVQFVSTVDIAQALTGRPL